MVNIGQGVLKRVRDEMFVHMQTLPIRFFDTHPHGEVMSLYTNDTDTLRQMINQSIPQTFAALISVITVFIVMLTLSVHLTLITILMVLVMLVLTKKIGGKSGKYFIAQQRTLGEINGQVEETFSGQNIVKAFSRMTSVLSTVTLKKCSAVRRSSRYSAMSSRPKTVLMY